MLSTFYGSFVAHILLRSLFFIVIIIGSLPRTNQKAFKSSNHKSVGLVGIVGKRITPEILKNMRELREKGATYNEIVAATGASKWACIQYLRDIKVDASAIGIAWRKAEKEAHSLLEQKGFTHILNLNEICPSPYWDYYAVKEDKRFLIDFTINHGKNLVAKSLQGIKGFNHFVLLKKGEEWKFIEIKTKEYSA